MCNVGLANNIDMFRRYAKIKENKCSKYVKYRQLM